MNTPTAFTEMKKAQDILMEAIDKSARTNLESVQKLLELNKERMTGLSDVSNPSDLIARQSAAFKEYAEHLSAHMEALTAIGTESREQLTELGQEFAKTMDFSTMFGLAEAPSKPKAKTSAKS
ncbi:phasin family protein [Wenzhouxiangella limi]|uniref:Phasin family protein n=2 Tax=Chromatiales TaxID=135613 RepID=A0A845URG9_9GAMM|nr:phasin family protein [Wenzhouxiangella limi]NDY94167.1 phasin family protein [Wenzhouxiangella limi]TQE98372.1 MAG: phasin family protein [Spiribacter salinus]